MVLLFDFNDNWHLNQRRGVEWYYEVKVHPGGHPYEGVGDACRKIIIQPPEATSLILVGLKP